MQPAEKGPAVLLLTIDHIVAGLSLCSAVLGRTRGRNC